MYSRVITVRGVAFLLLFLVVCPVPRASEPRANPPTRETIIQLPDLGSLTLQQAWRLDGVRTLFCVQLKDNGYRVTDDFDEYGCESRDREIERSVWFCAGDDKEGVVLVEGVLRVLHHPARVIGQTAFVGFTEFRLIAQ
jgi:hypothetical protein